jgi:hypothetical protein
MKPRPALVAFVVGVAITVILHFYFVLAWPGTYSSHPWPGYAPAMNEGLIDPYNAASQRALAVTRVCLLIVGFCVGFFVRRDRWLVGIASWAGFASAMLLLGLTTRQARGSNLMVFALLMIAWHTIPPVLLGFLAGSLAWWLARRRSGPEVA